MATPPPRSGKRIATEPRKASFTQQRGKSSAETPEVVDPIWLLKAGGGAILAALICGYLTLCLLFYQGQWQLVLHPDRLKPPLDFGGLPSEYVHFGVDESGSPQLAGWWLPATKDGRFATDTILYLPGGDGSLANAQQTLMTLHSLGINVFAFDYRGYGQSAAAHPDERRMTQDTSSAWRYLTESRAISGKKIIPFGDGVGTALAAQLAASKGEIPGIILQSPTPNQLASVEKDPRVRLLPVRALFHNTFDTSAAVARLKTPKLFLVKQNSTSLEIAESAALPKLIVTSAVSANRDLVNPEQIPRFLDPITGKAAQR